MPYNPIWSLTYIALGVFVIYALAAYGGAVEATLASIIRAASGVTAPASSIGPSSR